MCCKYNWYVLSLFAETSAHSVTLAGVETVTGPVYMNGYTHVTVPNFNSATTSDVMTEGVYRKGAGSNPQEAFSFKLQDANNNDVTNYDNILLSLKLTFQNVGNSNRIQVGGNGDWKGFCIYPSSDGSGLILGNDCGILSGSYADNIIATLDGARVGVSTFKNAEFILQITFDYSDTDLQMCFYINGVKYVDDTHANGVFTFADYKTGETGNYLTIFPGTEIQEK